MSTKFNIGADVWPGISKLVEEFSEVGQVCGKLLATDGDHSHWDGSNLSLRLEDELGDAQAAMQFVIEHNVQLDANRIAERAANKYHLFVKWHREGLEKRAGRGADRGE